jgi:Na+-driven multidrug efflux pump
MTFAPKLVKFFIDDNEAEVISYGTMFLRMISPFYVACCFNQIFGGALRGAGKSTSSMIIMLGSFVFARQIYLYIVANFIRLSYKTQL